jgi:hypothetical protein
MPTPGGFRGSRSWRVNPPSATRSMFGMSFAGAYGEQTPRRRRGSVTQHKGVGAMSNGWSEEPVEPRRLRPEVVQDVVRLLERDVDVEVAALVLDLLGVSEAERDLAFTMVRGRREVPLGGDVEALQAKIARLIFGAVPAAARDLG